MKPGGTSIVRGTLEICVRHPGVPTARQPNLPPPLPPSSHHTPARRHLPCDPVPVAACCGCGCGVEVDRHTATRRAHFKAARGGEGKQASGERKDVLLSFSCSLHHCEASCRLAEGCWRWRWLGRKTRDAVRGHTSQNGVVTSRDSLYEKTPSSIYRRTHSHGHHQSDSRSMKRHRNMHVHTRHLDMTFGVLSTSCRRMCRNDLGMGISQPSGSLMAFLCGMVVDLVSPARHGDCSVARLPRSRGNARNLPQMRDFRRENNCAAPHCHHGCPLRHGAPVRGPPARPGWHPPCGPAEPPARSACASGSACSGAAWRRGLGYKRSRAGCRCGPVGGGPGAGGKVLGGPGGRYP